MLGSSYDWVFSAHSAVPPVASFATVWSVVLFSSCCIQLPFTASWAGDGKGTLSKSLCRLFGSICNVTGGNMLQFLCVSPSYSDANLCLARLPVLSKHSLMCLKCTCEHYAAQILYLSATVLCDWFLSSVLFFSLPCSLFHACILGHTCGDVLIPLLWLGMLGQMDVSSSFLLCVYLHVSGYCVFGCYLGGLSHHLYFAWCTCGPSCLNVIACCLHAWRRDWGSDGEGRLYPGSERTDLHGNGLISVSGPAWHCPPHWWIGQCLHPFCLLLPGRWAQKQGKLPLLNPELACPLAGRMESPAPVQSKVNLIQLMGPEGTSMALVCTTLALKSSVCSSTGVCWEDGSGDWLELPHLFNT